MIAKNTNTNAIMNKIKTQNTHANDNNKDQLRPVGWIGRSLPAGRRLQKANPTILILSSITHKYKYKCKY